MAAEPKKSQLFSDDEESPKKMALFGADDEAGEEEIPAALGTIQVDEKYASNLLRRKREEELQIMRKKFGTEDDEDDMSEDETSDEDGYMLSDKKKIELANVLEAVRTGDTSKLQQEQFFYESESGSSTDGGYVSDAHKKHTYTLKSQLFDALGDDEDLSKLDTLAQTFEDQDVGPRAIAPAAEREKTKKEFLEIIKEAEMGMQNWDIKERPQTEEEAGKQQERDEKFWQSRQGRALMRDLQRKTLAKEKLEKVFDAETGDPTEQFLKDFFVNDRWSWTKATEEQAMAEEREEARKSKDKRETGVDGQKAGSSTDEEFTANQEIFEHVYEEFKYRHQEEGFEETPAPATTGPTLRRKESARKRRRELKAEREKERERAFQEELARAKQLKKQDLKAKTDMLKTLSGMKKERFSADVLHKIKNAPLEDYDKIMADIFNDEYYAEEDDEDFDPDKEWDEEKELQKLMGGDNSYQKRKLLQSVFSDSFQAQPEAAPAASSSSNKNNNAHDDESDSGDESDSKAVNKPPKVRTVSKATVQRELEQEVKYTQKELDEMGYEDVIAGGEIKCRFKYRNIDPIQFEGLDPMDIIVLPDPTLERIAPMRYFSTFRSKQERERDKRMVEERLKRLGDIDYEGKVGTKKYKKATGIDPKTWDELQQKLEEMKKQKEDKKVQQQAEGDDDEEAGYGGDVAEGLDGTTDKDKSKKSKKSKEKLKDRKEEKREKRKEKDSGDGAQEAERKKKPKTEKIDDAAV